MSNLEWMTALYGEPTSDDDEMTENVENRDFGPQIRQLFLTEGREHDAVFYSKPFFSRMHFVSSSCAGLVIPAGVTVSQSETYDAGLDSFSQNSRPCVNLDDAVSCECGEFTGISLMLDGSMAEIILRILKIEVPYSIAI